MNDTEFPPVVYLPCEAHVQDPADAVVELRRTNDSRMALMAYSALDRLKSCCGEQQPWLLLPTKMLERIQRVQPFELVLLDVVIPPELRTTPPRKVTESGTTVRHTTA
ncbi:hypothetical protein L3Q67_44005 [Saccharothrix sp. AJ9571]|nr:hypothetical protein L3Q67_44005 [Saccharothrix sp. AJ9571]